MGQGFSRAALGALAAGLIFATSASAIAQPGTVRVRGTIEKVDGNLLSFRSSEGAELKLTLAADALILALVKATMADIKEGTYLGSAAVPQADGSQKALEIHIFPEQMRGTGDGHRPYAQVPSGTMTNGATSGPVVTGIDGSTLVVKYKDGEQKILVTKDVPIVRYVLGDQSDLKPGARFTVFAPVRNADGSFQATRINVGRDGVVPP